MPESSQLNDSRGLLQLCYDKGFVVTLLYSLVSVFEYKGLCVRMLSPPVCYELDVCDRPLHSSYASLPPTHPFTTTHCLEFIKTSLVHACLVWFLS
jgi:hypothetical protein